MTDIGKTIKHAAMVSIRTLMVRSIRVIGRMINSMVKDKRYGPTVHNTKATISSDKKMDLVDSSGPTNPLSKVTFSKIIYMVKAHIGGQMVESIPVNGSATKCTAKDFSIGPIKDATKAVISTTKSTDMVS